MSDRLAGKIAVVTGGGRGIGAAICGLFADAGAKVVVANRTGELADAVAQSITDSGGTASSYQLDVTDKARCSGVIDFAAETYGGLDIVVHNAGVGPWVRLEELDDATLDDTLTVNLRACFWLTQAALPHLKASNAGRILVTSSVTGPRVAIPGNVHYAAAKAGVNGFVRGAALELAPHKITVNAVEPGLIEKPGRGSLSTGDNKTEAEIFIPLGEMGVPEDIGHLMVYLASDEARYVTGQCWPVDGGSLLVENPAYVSRTPKE